MGSRSPDLAGRVEGDGYAVVPDVLGPDEVAGLIDAIDREQAGPAVLRRGESIYGMRDLLRRVPEVCRLARSAAIRALVEPVLGPDAFVVRGLLFDKTPGANWNLPWHRDLTIAVRRRRDVPGFGPWTVKAGIPHVQPPAAVLRRMLAVRLHLDDCDEGNGPLNVLPGSHAVGDADVRDLRPWRGRQPAVTCVVRRGGAVLMRPLLLHASSSARAPGHRRIVHLEFAADPLPGGLQWCEAAEEVP